MCESRHTKGCIVGVVTAAAVTLLAISPFAIAGDEKAGSRERTGKSSTTNSESYAQFAGKKGASEWAGNGLKMKFVWCRLGHFEIGPLQRVDGKVVNENQEFDDRFRLMERRERQALGNANAEKPGDSDERDGERKNDPAEVDIPMVFLSHGFWLGQYEVTRHEWEAIMGTTPWKNRKVVVEGDDYPATYISWNDAMEFCRVLTMQEEEAGRLPRGWEYTLPTEAQWERACRAGTTTAYSFGSNAAQLSEYAWYGGIDGSHPHCVGQKKPNPWGLHDMHGNVLEWCRDRHNGRHPGGRDPEVTEGRNRVQRGGYWASRASGCKSSALYIEPPELKKMAFGFRVALRYAE
jgi:formylglycine-generating enzyme required for sulfatase activity